VDGSGAGEIAKVEEFHRSTTSKGIRAFLLINIFTLGRDRHSHEQFFPILGEVRGGDDISAIRG
jgi:hypothetical protein